ncbi:MULTISPECIES: MucBP domain-containing protein [unclassified Enterococcus]|uniref:MucBP domain-containing protein n=1 Tax=unclassified Enterococcus TaxID=2608891 RepID=UPI0015572B6A|nr:MULTISPECIES: MucBP domain-containing protein [unclassified Enterococcus]MBS7576936.1 BspA family leucine-rich repeat surface protein [Enterococcus sp. MMGLQ5-2]MBS7584343.1 BspA family leucine-rich repeat surface protein [Enterococcus sp. MMGLQ5-1]NPD12198.1 BspA family leucine-rich repeat surface protein [Enterococcus sp. MMGLQ5-1]NPD36770.1 BspA family leucine-rich repeat surface protein [Enterococcus sp. MMGLQ5-2]
MNKKIYQFFSLIIVLNILILSPTATIYAVEQDSLQGTETVTTDSSENNMEDPQISDVGTEQNSLQDIEIVTTDSTESSLENQQISGYTEFINVSDEIASGTLGTSNWTLLGNGDLQIDSGVLAATNSEGNPSPWREYADQIQTITFTGDVKANAISMYLFAYLPELTTINNIEKLDTSNVKNMSGLFRGCISLQTLDLSAWNISNVTDISDIFYGCNSLNSLNTTGWDTSNVFYMDGTFNNTGFSSIDVSEWDTQNVITMNAMFAGMQNLITIDLSNFKTDNLADMALMFSNCESLITIDLSNFNTDNVERFLGLFSWCLSLKTINLSSFNTSLAREIGSQEALNDLFSGCNSLSSLILGENSIFASSADLSEINTTSNVYTGRWIGLKTNNVYDSSTVFMDSYDGTIPDTYIWERTSGVVTIKYLDQQDNEIHDSQSITGYYDEAFDTTSLDYKLQIEGYTLDANRLPENGTGSFKVEEQTVIYYYNKNADVTVYYLDEDGNSIADKKILSGDIGDAFTTEKLSIEGYTFKEVQGNVTGTFTDQEQTVTYVYTKNSDTVNANASSSDNKLPTTGSTFNPYVSVVGLLLLLGIIPIKTKFKH